VSIDAVIYHWVTSKGPKDNNRIGSTIADKTINHRVTLDVHFYVRKTSGNLLFALFFLGTAKEQQTDDA
jgi:hypothetical protein